MKPLFSTYILKGRAKTAMRGKFFKAFAISVIPSLVIAAFVLLIILCVPDASESFKLALSGKFESMEARMLYLDNITEICMRAVNLLSVVFAFLSVGAQKLFLDMLRGKDIKVRKIFCYYNKWYIAALYPALTVTLTTVIRLILDNLAASGMNADAVTLLAWVLQIAIYFVAFKLMFVEYILAENNCAGIVKAFKQSWHMVGWNTAINSVILSLSFIGWIIASMFTLGAVLIYLMPYMSLSVAALYDENKKIN